MNLLYIFIGGGIGSVCRYLISSVINQHSTVLFPFGTFAANLIGSFVMGLCFYIFQKTVIPVEIRILITIGFLGGFTTYSTFCIESVNLFKEGEYLYFLLNMVLTNIISLIMAVGGMYLGKIILKLIKII